MQPQLPSDILKVLVRYEERIATLEKSLTNDAVPVGAIIDWPAVSTLLPFNYLPADGRAIDRIAYAALFQQIGTTHGTGDGSTTFNIPDRGCQIYMDASAARSGCVLLDGASYLRATYPDLFNCLGGASSPWGLPDGTHFNVPDLRGRTSLGSGTGTGLTARSLAGVLGEENHLLSTAEMPSHIHFIDQGNGAVGSGNFNTPQPNSNFPGNASTLPTGGGGVHNNMQPSLVFNFFISTSASTVIKVL